MVALEWDMDRTDGVTLVRLYVTADDARRVRIEPRLDGPVWPPRRHGQPAAGWDDDTFEGIVTPNERLVVGFSTPAKPADPPATVVSDEPANPTAATGPVVAPGDAETAQAETGAHRPTAADGGDESLARNSTLVGDVGQTPAGVVRSLGDPIVPRDAVPVPETTAPDTDPSARSSKPDESTSRSGDADPPQPRSKSPESEKPDGQTAPGSSTPDSHAVDPALAIPGPVRTWLRDVKRRLDAVERQGAQPPVTGPLAESVAVDRRAMAHVAAQVETLTERADQLTGESTEDQRPPEAP